MKAVRIWGVNSTGGIILSVASFFNFLGWGVRLSPLGTSATNWPKVAAPYER
jgi:hypothetical protein